jgi:hypothetical protein
MIGPDANKPTFKNQCQEPIDWFNETYSSYCAADYIRAQAAATMYLAEGLEALRLWCRVQSGEIKSSELDPPGSDVTKP